jgi:hypothetical protein
MKTHFNRLKIILSITALIWSSAALAGNANFVCDLLDSLPVPGFLIEIVGPRLDCGCLPPCRP